MKKIIYFIVIALLNVFATPVANAVVYTNVNCGTSGSFTYNDSHVLVWSTSCVGSVVIPEGVTSIDSRAFQSANITDVTFPSTLTTILDNVFLNATTSSVNFGSNSHISSIGYNAFGSARMTTLDLPASLTTIADYAFYGVSNLTSLVFHGNSLTSIGISAFAVGAASTSISQINLPNSVTTLSATVFNNRNSLKYSYCGNVSEATQIAAKLLLANHLPCGPSQVNTTRSATQLSITVTPGLGVTGNSISNYKYSLDGGTTYTSLSPASGNSTFVISSLTNGQNYSVALMAVNSAGDSLPVFAPTLSGATSSSGPASGGTSVQISGHNLSSDIYSTLFFKDALGSLTGPVSLVYSLPDSSTVTTTSPLKFSGAGSVNIEMTTPTGIAALTGGFTYLASPTITSISPNKGIPAGGTTITISGTNLNGTSAITFGGGSWPGSSITNVDSSTVTVVIPSHNAGAVDVVLTNPGGSVTSAGGFTYGAVPDPNLPVFSPSSGTTSGGTTLTMVSASMPSASNSATTFETLSSITFDGVAATIVSNTLSGSTRTVVLTTPAHAAGAVAVVITNSFGSMTYSAGTPMFTYVTPVVAPTIASASISGTTTVGETLTATAGSNSGGAIASTMYEWSSGSTPSGSYSTIGTNSATYQLVSGDVNKYIRVKITVTNASGSASETSTATAQIAAALTAPTIPSASISGTTTVGQTLTATAGSNTGGAIASTTYEWSQASSPSGSYSAIGSNAASYVLASADEGKYIRVKITVANAAGAASETSTATAQIAAVPATPATPATPPSSSSGNSSSSTHVLPKVVVTGAKSATFEVVSIPISNLQDGESLPISTVVGATSTTNANSITLNSIVGKVSSVRYSNSGFEITPETGFSGNISVEIKSEGSNGQSVARLSMTVLPEPVTNVAAKPTSASISQISWLKSVNANSYAVLMDGKTICTTTANSCSISKLVGPKSIVEIIPLGGDSTVGSKVDAHYGAPAAPILVSKVSVALARNTMSAADYLSVDKVIKLVNQQGFSSVTISDISTTSKTVLAVKARLDAIVKYVKSKVADSNVRINIVAPKGKTYLNTFAVS